MDTKETCHNVCIIRVSVLSGWSEKMSRTRFIDKKTKADVFTATVASSFQRNLTIIYYSLVIKSPLISIVLKTRQWRLTLLCTTSVLFRTTFTGTIILNPHVLKWNDSWGQTFHSFTKVNSLVDNNFGDLNSRASKWDTC